MKKSLITFCILLFASSSFAQEAGQDFCAGTEEGSYFPLDIQKKNIVWSGTRYTETKTNTKSIAGKQYTEYTQTWANGDQDKLYLREQNGVIYQGILATGTEFVRYNPSFKKGHTWSGGVSFATFKIKSTRGTLVTPYCKYTNLLVIVGTYEDGQSFKFYYQRGFGYVGATNKKGLVSYASPV
jgi:hypothetical protein